MQPTSKSATPGLIAPATAKAGSPRAQGEDGKSGPAAMLGKQESKKSLVVEEPDKPLGAYQVRAGASQVKASPPLPPAAIQGSADALSRAHARADAHLRAFLHAEGESLPPRERSLFAEFLDHGEYGLAYDTAIVQMNSGCKWPEASLAHLQAAAQAMGIQFPGLAHD